MAEKSDHDAHEAGPEATDPGDASHKAGSHRVGSRFSRIAGSEGAALLVEFVKMSRTTAVILIVFVLTLALYMLVRQDPVVAFNAPPRADSSETESSRTDSAETDEPTSSDQPATNTEPSGTQMSTSPTGTSGTEVPPPGDQRGIETGEGQDGDQPQQSPQVSPSPQTPTGQSPQQSQQTRVPVS